jgi:hypothetical protein
MTKNYIKSLAFSMLTFLAVAFTANAQVVFTQWTFEGDVITPSTGSGTAALIGGTSATFATGYTGTGTGGRAWNSAGYPEQGVGSGTAGVEFVTSTSGYNSFQVSWDGRHSNTSANRVRLQYTLNGTDWVNFGANAANASNTVAGVDKGFDNGRFIADAGDTWFQRSANFASVSGAGNNAAFAIRIVTEFLDGSGYGAATSGSNYSVNGTLRYDNVTFTGSGTSPFLTATPSNISGFTYVIGGGPSEIQTTTLGGLNLTPAAGSISVTAPADFEISSDGVTFSSNFTIAYTNGAFNDKTVSIRLKSGLAAGSYSGGMTVSGGGASDLSVALSGSVTMTNPAAISSIILPRFIQGAVPNNNRVPFAYHAALSNLLPSSTYRFYNTIILGSDAPDYNGAGNCIFVDASTGTFTRTTGVSFTTAGGFGEFTTDASGNYSGWFITEPTGNPTRFKPGAELFVRIVLNDGAGGTTELTRLTSTESVKVLGFNTMSADTTGTAIRGISENTPKNFVFLYDNTAGTGRPLYGTQVETSGIDFVGVGTYAAFYSENVAGTNGAWGGIVPNINANGVRRVEERSLLTGAIVSDKTAANGVWGTVDTKDPSGGSTNVLVVNTTLGIDSPVSEIGRIYAIGKTVNLELNQVVNGTVYIINLNGKLVAEHRINGSNASFRSELPEGIYFVRIISEKISVSSKVFIR